MEPQKLLLGFCDSRNWRACVRAAAGVLGGRSLKREACASMPVVARISSTMRGPTFTARSFRARVSSLARS